MNKDKALEELFLARQPHFADGDDFMAALTKRLDAVEYIKQHQEATIRRYKMAMVAAFLVGIFSGAITMIYVLSMPADVPLFTFRMQAGLFLWLTENSRLIAAMTIALLMSIGLMSIISNVQDIISMRTLHSSLFTLHSYETPQQQIWHRRLNIRHRQELHPQQRRAEPGVRTHQQGLPQQGDRGRADR